MIIVTGNFRIKAEDMERLRAGAHWFAPTVRKEEGCLGFGFGPDMLDPSYIRVQGLWAHEQALEDHSRSNHAKRMAKLMAKLSPFEGEAYSFLVTSKNLLWSA